MSGTRRQAGARLPAITRTFRILPSLRPHAPDLALGLRAVSDPKILRSFILRFRSLVDRGADAPKTKLRLDPDLDLRLQDLVGELKDVVRPEIAVYEMVNAALLAARCDRLATTYTKRTSLPDESRHV